MSEKYEVTSLKSLLHPSIPIVVDSFFNDKDAYIVEDFIDGETLESAMKENSRATQRQRSMYSLSRGNQLDVCPQPLWCSITSTAAILFTETLNQRIISSVVIVGYFFLISVDCLIEIECLIMLDCLMELSSIRSCMQHLSFMHTLLKAARESHSLSASIWCLWGVGAVLVHAICGALFCFLWWCWVQGNSLGWFPLLGCTQHALCLVLLYYDLLQICMWNPTGCCVAAGGLVPVSYQPTNRLNAWAYGEQDEPIVTMRSIVKCVPCCCCWPSYANTRPSANNNHINDMIWYFAPEALLYRLCVSANLPTI